MGIIKGDTRSVDNGSCQRQVFRHRAEWSSQQAMWGKPGALEASYYTVGLGFRTVSRE